jgi:hypothetical protein
MFLIVVPRRVSIMEVPRLAVPAVMQMVLQLAMQNIGQLTDIRLSGSAGNGGRSTVRPA